MQHYHAYDPATGQIMQAWFESLAEASRLTGLGYTVVLAPLVDMTSHYYLDGKLTPKAVVTLTPDKASIPTDGKDAATVTVAVEGAAPGSIDLLVEDDDGSLSVPVALVDGKGGMPPIVGSVPGTLVVSVADSIRYTSEAVKVQVLDA